MTKTFWRKIAPERSGTRTRTGHFVIQIVDDADIVLMKWITESSRIEVR